MMSYEVSDPGYIAHIQQTLCMPQAEIAEREQATAALAELRETAREGMRDMRLLIFQLRPPELETEGLMAVLQARLAAVEARAGLQVDFRVDGERRLLSPSRQIFIGSHKTPSTTC
jgi:signal transduction histidine kinase